MRLEELAWQERLELSTCGLEDRIEPSIHAGIFAP